MTARVVPEGGVACVLRGRAVDYRGRDSVFAFYKPNGSIQHILVPHVDLFFPESGDALYEVLRLLVERIEDLAMAPLREVPGRLEGVRLIMERAQAEANEVVMLAAPMVAHMQMIAEA